MMKMKGFKGFKTYALVTGAASGMGRIYSLELARKGYNIIMVDINAAGLMDTERMVKADILASAKISAEDKKAFRALSVVQDLSVTDAADKIFETTEAAGCVSH